MRISYFATLLVAPTYATIAHSLAEVHLSSSGIPIDYVSGVYIPSTTEDSIQGAQLIAGKFNNDCEFKLSSDTFNSSWVLFVDEHHKNCSLQTALETEAAAYIFVGSLTTSRDTISGLSVPTVLVSSSSGKELAQAIQDTNEPLLATFAEIGKTSEIHIQSAMSKTLFDVGVVLGVLLLLVALLLITLWTRRRRRNAILAAVVESEKKQERRTADALKDLPIIEYVPKPPRNKKTALMTSEPSKKALAVSSAEPAASVCVDMDSTDPSGDTEEDSDCCAICYDDFSKGDTHRQLPCDHSHMFHLACIDKWLLLNRKCPICKTNFMYPGQERYRKLTTTTDTAVDVNLSTRTELM